MVMVLVLAMGEQRTGGAEEDLLLEERAVQQQEQVGHADHAHHRVERQLADGQLVGSCVQPVHANILVIRLTIGTVHELVGCPANPTRILPKPKNEVCGYLRLWEDIRAEDLSRLELVPLNVEH